MGDDDTALADDIAVGLAGSSLSVPSRGTTPASRIIGRRLRIPDRWRLRYFVADASTLLLVATVCFAPAADIAAGADVAVMVATVCLASAADIAAGADDAVSSAFTSCARLLRQPISVPSARNFSAQL